MSATAPLDAPPRASRAGIAGWVLFDWSTQPFFTLVTTFVFAPFFASKIAATPAEGQALWGYATAAAGITIALLSPILGSIADHTGPRKPWILVFGLMMAIGCTLLWFGRPGHPELIPMLLFAFALASIGAEFATVFNNAMMPTLVPQERIGRLSGLGWAVGYVGGLVSLVLTLGFLAASPETGKTLLGMTPLFGLNPAEAEGDRASGPLTALWFAVFVLPLLLFTPDIKRGLPFSAAIGAGLASLKATFADIRGRANVFRFLIANMIYMDGLIALFAFGGIYAAGVFGWTTIEIGIFGILLTITGTFGSLVGGWADDRFGSRPVVMTALVILVVCTVTIISIDKSHIFFVVPAAGPVPGDGLYATTGEKLYILLGAFIGIAAGPVQAASRSMLAHLAPKEQVGQYFGFFAFSGKATSFVGPFLVALVTDLSDSQRVGIAVLIAFFALGFVLISRVKPAG